MNAQEWINGPVCVAYNTLSGAQHGQLPGTTLVQRAAASHAAGLTSIGASSDDLISVDPWWLQRLIRRHHITIDELEWVSLETPRDRTAEDRLFRLADLFHVKRLNVGVCTDAKLDYPTLVTRLRHLAIRASDHELVIAVEPVVFGSLSSIPDVEHLIEDAAQPNIGTLLDTFHQACKDWNNGCADQVTPGLVVAVQVCGVDLVSPAPDYPDGLFREAQCGRRLPGEGDFPVTDWLHDLYAAGVRAPLDVEVISDELRSMNVYDAAARVAASWAAFTSSQAVSPA